MENLERQYLQYKNSRFAYLQFGRGETLLLAFPGFANEADIFLKIKDSLVKKYTVIALDLPYHGATKIREERFSKEDYIQVLQKIIQLFPDKQGVEIMGYSYGGRLCLGLFSALNIQKIYLVAADGLEERRGYNFFPTRLRRLIIRLFNRPKIFLAGLNFLHKIGLVPAYTQRFMTYHLENAAKRSRLFGTWLFTAEFVSRPQEILNNLKQKDIPVQIIYGQNDRIIDANGGLKLAEQYPKARVHFIDTGHKIIGQKLNDFLQEYLKN